MCPADLVVLFHGTAGEQGMELRRVLHNGQRCPEARVIKGSKGMMVLRLLSVYSRRSQTRLVLCNIAARGGSQHPPYFSTGALLPT